MMPFLVWLVVFYGVWVACVTGLGAWDRLVEHWPIAAAMALGHKLINGILFFSEA